MIMTQRYPYEKIQKTMKDALLEYVKELNEDREKLLSLDDASYRNNIFNKMKNNDENIEKIFPDKMWAETLTQGNQTVVLLDEYLEGILKKIMDEFNFDHPEFLGVYKEWDENSETFQMANVYVEELITEEEWDKGVEEFKNLLKIYADKFGLSPLRAKLKMPPFDNVFDKVDWIKHELDETTIDDALEEAKPDVEVET